MWGLRIFVEMWYIYIYIYIYCSHIPDVISTNMLIGNEIFVFKYPVSVNNIFQIPNTFIKIKVNFWLLSAHPIMTCIIFHIWRPKTQENVRHIVRFYVSADVHQKHVFHIEPFRSKFHILKRFMCLEVNKVISNWNKGKILILVVSTFKKRPIGSTGIQYKLMRQISLWISVSYGLCEFNCVAIWNKGKRIILVKSTFQICQLDILVSYST